MRGHVSKIKGPIYGFITRFYAIYIAFKLTSARKSFFVFPWFYLAQVVHTSASTLLNFYYGFC